MMSNNRQHVLDMNNQVCSQHAYPYSGMAWHTMLTQSAFKNILQPQCSIECLQEQNQPTLSISNTQVQNVAPQCTPKL